MLRWPNMCRGTIAGFSKVRKHETRLVKCVDHRCGMSGIFVTFATLGHDSGWLAPVRLRGRVRRAFNEGSTRAEAGEMATRLPLIRGATGMLRR